MEPLQLLLLVVGCLNLLRRALPKWAVMTPVRAEVGKSTKDVMEFRCNVILAKAGISGDSRLLHAGMTVFFGQWSRFCTLAILPLLC